MERTETKVTPQVSPPVTLAVTEHGPRRAATHVLLLHGFPDDQRMWDPLLESLPDEWHLITYDARGAGRSSRPEGRAAYRTALLVEDLVAVLDATVPDGARVHLVGHDWGSTVGWDAVAAATWDPRLEGRIATYTSASGPPLDHLASQTDSWSGRLRMLPQTLRSWYVWLFLVPRLPELVMGRAQRLLRPAVRRLDPTIDLLPWGQGVRENTSHTVDLYRANVLPRLRHPVPWRTSIPVLLVVARRDPFVTPRALEHLDARCRDLTRVEVDSGHWLPRAHPEALAALVRDFVEAHPG